MFAAQCYSGENVFSIAGSDYADRNLAIVGAIGGVQSAAAGVEADFTSEMAAKGGFEGESVDLHGNSR
jgi:hypothetical protein